MKIVNRKADQQPQVYNLCLTILLIILEYIPHTLKLHMGQEQKLTNHLKKN